MSRGLLITVFGQGGYRLDPANGMRAIAAKGIARGLTCRAEPYDYTDRPVIVSVVRQYAKANPGKPIFFAADSCGANLIAQLIADLAPIKIDYAAPIQASMYCNFDYPKIKANCARIRVFYSDVAHTAGLGTFIPQPELVPAKPVIRGGWHVVNNGATLWRADYVPAFHPDDDDVANVQSPIFADIDAILAAAEG